MVKLGTALGALLVAILSVTPMMALRFPSYMAIGLTLFGACLAGLLGLALRLALVDRARGDHEH